MVRIASVTGAKQAAGPGIGSTAGLGWLRTCARPVSF